MNKPDNNWRFKRHNTRVKLISYNDLLMYYVLLDVLLDYCFIVDLCKVTSLKPETF